MVGRGEGAVKDANVGNGCHAIYGVEQGRIGLCRAEGDGMILTVESAAEVADGCPVRAGRYSDVRRQAIVASGIGGEVINQVYARCDVLACVVGLVSGIGNAGAVIVDVFDTVVIIIR